MILVDTIYNKLLIQGEDPKTLRYNFDVRYLQRWIKKHPNVFPKYILNNNFNCNNYERSNNIKKAKRI